MTIRGPNAAKIHEPSGDPNATEIGDFRQAIVMAIAELARAILVIAVTTARSWQSHFPVRRRSDRP
jgi:hypothetical protein